MIGKEKILEAWIMVEHLSEGDIRPQDKSLLRLEEQDFHALFRREIEKKKFRPKQKGGLAVYFDIFDFREVVSILREQYHLEPTHEEVRSGSKFSFALYFDKELKFLEDMTFFTESAYIRYFKEVPQAEQFRNFEADLKQQFAQDFDETAESPEKFNAAVRKEMQRYGVRPESCRIQLLNSVETEGTNLHSFFIGDLEKAKGIDTENLRAYLYGSTARRVNLDSRKDSPRFHPQAFETILRPENYPLGRFPSKTAFALSLMQQAAVNLSVGADSQTIRSVNGPPGTGKTTLLKDIFAQLTVQQAYDIAKLPERCVRGTEATVYYERASIGMLPAQIAENGIVVASSNNGAVQNIVNELPLRQGIDEALLEELLEADYFREISNAKVSAVWKEDETGKRREQLACEPCEGEELFWGMFSLEGGKSDNMSNILTHIKLACRYLEETYQPEPELYRTFLEQYEAVRALRSQAQAAAESLQAGRDCLRELEEARAVWQRESAGREKALEDALQKLEAAAQEDRRQLSGLRLRLEESAGRKNAAQKKLGALERFLEENRSEKPGLLASRQEREAYRNRLGALTDQLLKLQDEEAERAREESRLREEAARRQERLKRAGEQQAALRTEFSAWRSAAERKIAALEKKAGEYEAAADGGRFPPLDLRQEYDALQLSNPWFDEAYRIAQSKLFLTALRVRKQFLYENRRNLRAAVSVWNQQEKYLDRRAVIEAAWHWINLAVPVVSSTFASFSRMCRNLGPETLGHLFIDEAGQALPQAAVGAVFRSRHVMVVGDPSQIKPVLTLDSNTLRMLSEYFGVTEKYLSASASAQTLVDAASRYGFYRGQEEDSWIGIPLWVHRRCQYPMFTISNAISYDGLMVQGMKANGKTGWFDVGGKASGKYVEEQGEFLVEKIRRLMEKDPKIGDKAEKDVIYVITPFSNVAYQLAQKLRKIHFTRYDGSNKPTNVGTVHTFQGKEAPIVFFVLGADRQSSGAARWAVGEPNMMNVAATRAKKEFYIIGDRKLYLSLGCEVASETDRIIREYKRDYPELVEETPPPPPAFRADERRGPPRVPAPAEAPAGTERMTGKVKFVRKGETSCYAYIAGDDGTEYCVTETIYLGTERASEVIQTGRRISFIPAAGRRRPLASDVKPAP